MSRLGANYFQVCATCGVLGHTAQCCSLKEHYHQQAQRALANGSRDPEILREVYGLKTQASRGPVESCR